MPIVSVKIAKGRPVETKRRLVDSITRTVVETLDVEPQWVTVLIEELDRENWATGGMLHSDRPGAAVGR